MKVKLVNENFTSDYVSNLLKARGVADVEAYLNPTSEYLIDPSNLKNIGVAAALYLRVVQNNPSRILLIVDSDLDGFTSSAIIYQYTQQINPNCKIDYWLHEGKAHGLQDHIDKLMEEGYQYDLVILADSSSNDKEYHDALDELGLPCLVIDHHLIDNKLSYNAVIVNNQTSPNYPNKELTGAGMVYQFCRYIDTKIDQNWAENYIDLAALGIVGDMGSMLEMENRYIVKTAFTKERLRNEFFKCLLNKQAYSITGKTGAMWGDIVAKTDPISVAFYIVPLVNAMIRVGTMPEKERLFRAFINGGEMVPSGKRGAKGTMERVDVESARECTNAKSKQNKILDDAVFAMEVKIFNNNLLDNKVLFCRLDEEDFPSELNGLLAMKLSAKYKKPTIVARLNNEGYNRGSARGLNQSELKDFKKFMNESSFFEYAQGHANACGCSIPDANLKAFHEYANKELANIDFGENAYDVNFARTATAADLSALTMEIGKYSSIWGQNNPQPLVHITKIMVDPSNIRIMGSNADTLKIEYMGMPYLKFHAKELIEEIQNHTAPFEMEIVGKPNLNEWCGRISPQIFIEDYEII